MRGGSRYGQRQQQPRFAQNQFVPQQQREQQQAQQQGQSETLSSISNAQASQLFGRAYTAVALPNGTIFGWIIGKPDQSSLKGLLRAKLILDKKVDITGITREGNSYKMGHFGGWDYISEQLKAFGQISAKTALNIAGGNALYWGVRPLSPSEYYTLGDENTLLWIWQFFQFNIAPFTVAASGFAQSLDAMLADSYARQLTEEFPEEFPSADAVLSGQQLIDAVIAGDTSMRVLIELGASVSFFEGISPSVLSKIAQVAPEFIDSMQNETGRAIRQGMLGGQMAAHSGVRQEVTDQLLDFFPGDAGLMQDREAFEAERPNFFTLSQQAQPAPAAPAAPAQPAQPAARAPYVGWGAAPRR